MVLGNKCHLNKKNYFNNTKKNKQTNTHAHTIHACARTNTVSGFTCTSCLRNIWRLLKQYF